jgi:hypothetical protein
MGYCDATSPKIIATNNCPQAMIGIHHIAGGPANTSANANSVDCH